MAEKQLTVKISKHKLNDVRNSIAGLKIEIWRQRRTGGLTFQGNETIENQKFQGKKQMTIK